MAIKKVIPVEDAVALIQDGDVLATTGYGGNGTPEALFVALEERFVDSGQPRGLTLVHAGGQGDGRDKGLNHLGHEGLLKRVIGGHYGLIPKIAKLAAEDKIEAYNFPEGTIHPPLSRHRRGQAGDVDQGRARHLRRPPH